MPITVIMPLKYYRTDFLEKALGSIIDQTCPNWRMVIVVEESDVSRFRTLLDEPLQDQRVELIANQRHGFAGAINSGVQYADTEFVGLLLGDDMWETGAVATLRDYILNFPRVDFFHTSRVFIDQYDNPISAVYSSKNSFELDDFKWGSPVKHLLCWRRAKGMAVGGVDETIQIASDDYDFPWTMAENRAVFKAVDECLYLYRNHCSGERFTTHIPKSTTIREIRKILKKHRVGLFERFRIICVRNRSGSIGKQSIYRTPFDRWIKKKVGYNASQNWQQEEYSKAEDPDK